MTQMDERTYYAQGVLMPWPNMVCSAIVMATPVLWVNRMQAISVLHRLRGVPEETDRVQAWVGHHAALALYIAVMSRELERRGGADQRPMHQPFLWDGRRNPDHEVVSLPDHVSEVQMPAWLGTLSIHMSHREFLDEKFEREVLIWR